VKVALVDRYPRESFQLATKLPAWAGPKTASEAKDMLQTSLERTGAGYFDFYLLHNLGGNRTKYFDDYGLWDYLAEQKAKGIIKHLGFSMHDSAAVLDTILTAHPEMDFVQLQINYADWDSSQVESRKCYEVARKHKKPVIIMEPVKGGALATLPEHMASMFKKEDAKSSLASWAIRYAASLEGLVTVLSGMSTLEQMQDNLAVMEDFKPLTDKEREVIKKIQEELTKMPNVPCTSCQYCVKDCPQNINIPGVLSALNGYLTYQNIQKFQGDYSWETRESGKASGCIACGQCEEACPQHIHIIEELEKAAALEDRGNE